MKKFLSKKLVISLVKMAAASLLSYAVTRAARWAINKGQRKLLKK